MSKFTSKIKMSKSLKFWRREEDEKIMKAFAMAEMVAILSTMEIKILDAS
jgi:hypothetical protein